MLDEALAPSQFRWSLFCAFLKSRISVFSWKGFVRTQRGLLLPGRELAPLQVQGHDADGADPGQVARPGLEVEMAKEEPGKVGWAIVAL